MSALQKDAIIRNGTNTQTDPDINSPPMPGKIAKLKSDKSEYTKPHAPKTQVEKKETTSIIVTSLPSVNLKLLTIVEF